MKRLLLFPVFLSLLSTPALATSSFSRQWKTDFLGEDADPDFVKTARRAGCYVCHVKGHPDKKKARNEYGKAVYEFLDMETYSRDYIKANPEKAAKEISEGFKKAGEKLSSSGEKFSDKLEVGKLPAEDAGL
ncbi:MAG: hypothetical protein AAF539_03010 [Planctomycetota bacterium]